MANFLLENDHPKHNKNKKREEMKCQKKFAKYTSAPFSSLTTYLSLPL